MNRPPLSPVRTSFVSSRHRGELHLPRRRPVHRERPVVREAPRVHELRVLELRERLLLRAVAQHEAVRRRVQPHRVVVLPVHGQLRERQRREVRLLHERRREVAEERPALPLGRLVVAFVRVRLRVHLVVARRVERGVRGGTSTSRGDILLLRSDVLPSDVVQLRRGQDAVPSHPRLQIFAHEHQVLALVSDPRRVGRERDARQRVAKPPRQTRQQRRPRQRRGDARVARPRDEDPSRLLS
eukprot:31190-Pelagococcus_subviridis.AAC.11